MRICFSWIIKIFLSLLLILFSLANLSKTYGSEIHGSIAGTIVDIQTSKPLFGANVMIEGTLLGTASDMEGSFRIERIPPGEYRLIVTMMGYKKNAETQFRIVHNRETEINLQLEPTVLKQPTLIVTASKRQQLIENAPTTVDVIDRRNIQEHGVSTLDEILQNTPGLVMIDKQINLRGSTGFNKTGSRVLFMVDSHSMISGDNGGINWDIIPPDEVEQIEVVKGAGSALYGSNAMAGVVNVITRDPSPVPETQFKFTYGFYDNPAYSEWIWWENPYRPFYLFGLKKLNLNRKLNFKGIHISHSRHIGNVGILFNLGRKISTGYTQNGDFSRWNVLGKIKIRFSPDKTLSLSGIWALNDHDNFIKWLGPDRPMNVLPEELSDWVRSEKTFMKGTFQHSVNKKFAYNLKGNYYRYYWKNYFNDNQDYATTDKISFEAQGHYLVDIHSLTFGNEIIFNTTESIIFKNRNTWDFALYCEDEIKLSALWTFNLGARFDYHHVKELGSDQQLSPRMGLVYRPLAHTILRLSGGHGFRAPSIAEVFPDISLYGYKVVPNLNLKNAERAWICEFGINQTMISNRIQAVSYSHFLKNPAKWIAHNINPSLSADIAFFASWYRDMIDVPIENLEYAQFKYIGDARILGMETRIISSFFNGHLTANLGYTLLDPVRTDSSVTLPYRSRHQITTGLLCNLGRISVGWDYRYASRIEEIVYIPGTGYVELVPIHVMDCRVNFNLGSVDLGIECKNMRNYHYVMRQGLLEPIRHFIFTLRGKF
jgi:outer membrane receptor for ferrienterochelin and colicins